MTNLASDKCMGLVDIDERGLKRDATGSKRDGNVECNYPCHVWEFLLWPQCSGMA
jgi:hypothetical protein